MAPFDLDACIEQLLRKQLLHEALLREICEKTKEVFGRIDVVFNNARVGLVGEVEGTPEDVARKLFEVTFWGADRISREAVRFFREVNKPEVGGRLLNNSSMVGINAFPGMGYYSASKHGELSLTY